RTAEQVVAGTVAAVVVIRARRVVGGVNDSAFRIDAHRESPLRRTGTIPVAVAAPRFDAGIAGLLRNRSELPHLRARARIESARSAGIAVRADDEQVPVDGGRGFVRNNHIDFTAVAESGNRFAGVGAQSDQASSRSKEDAR